MIITKKAVPRGAGLSSLPGTGRREKAMRYFMRGTPWAGYEAMMMSVPRNVPRGGGRRRARLEYTREDLDCKLCIEYRGKSRCAQKICPYLVERLEAGTVSYTELVLEAFRGAMNRPFTERLKSLSSELRGCQYTSEEHRGRMEDCLHALWPDGNVTNSQWLAACFLMTSSASIWRGVRVSRYPRKIEWEQISITPETLQDYVLLQSARSILDGKTRISAYELSDRTLVDDLTLRVIMDAAVLARFGITLLEIGGTLCDT